MRALLDESVVTFASQIREIAAEKTDAEPWPIVEIELLGDNLQFQITEYFPDEADESSGTFVGFLEGEDYSEVRWSFFEDAESAIIHVHGKTVYNIDYAGEGNHRVTKWDADKLADCARCAESAAERRTAEAEVGAKTE